MELEEFSTNQTYRIPLTSSNSISFQHIPLYSIFNQSNFD